MFNTPGCHLILSTFERCRFGDTKEAWDSRLTCWPCLGVGRRRERGGWGLGGRGRPALVLKRTLVMKCARVPLLKDVVVVVVVVVVVFFYLTKLDVK